jgi:GTP-binding protein
MQVKITTSMLLNVLSRAVIANPPAKVKNTRLQIKFATQTKSVTPTFVIFVNNPQAIHFTYMRYIENTIRQAFKLDKVPILIYYKDKNARIRQDDIFNRRHQLF